MTISSDTSSEQSVSFPWYGVRTRANHESVAAKVLQSKGYEQYLPVYKTRKRWSDRITETERPLFPGYVFCRFDASRKLPIVSTPGVVSVVGFGKDPAPICDSEIDAIRRVLVSGLPSEPCPYLREGQRVRIQRGALENIEGILIKKKSEWRMIVSVTMLQRSISIEIDTDWISAI